MGLIYYLGCKNGELRIPNCTGLFSHQEAIIVKFKAPVKGQPVCGEGGQAAGKLAATLYIEPPLTSHEFLK